MLRSLFSGVTGLQSHQIAMDVESNNIANVNTIGYKYSRANFSDLLAQTNQIATAPQGELGGKNAVQIGLGSSITSVTRIHSQGSIQNTDKNTDVAIQGDGFFIVSSDGGNTYKYSRSGDFKFDGQGNFVDNNGFIVQGWLRDKDTGLVDSTAPIANIQIPPGLTTPANASSAVVVKANLSSSGTVTQYSPTYIIDNTGAVTTPDGRTAVAEDLGVMFDGSGDAFQLTPSTTADPYIGQGITVSFNGGATSQNFRYTNDATLAGTTDTATSPETYYFQTTADLRSGLETFAQSTSPGSEVTVNNQGKFIVGNAAGTAPLTLAISSIVDTNTVENTRFTANFATMAGALPIGTSVKQSQAVNAASHSASIDIYDSLGSKHTVKMDFRKQSINTTNGITEWGYTITVPQPGSIGGVTPYENILEGGIIQFGSNGQLVGYNVPSIDFSPNNGAAPNQAVNLDFGSIGAFDGITSFDNPSATSGISQDGFPGGDLVGIRIDQSGTLVGSFSNGRSFGLAQIGMAKFANNEGLVSDGGNVYLQSANSGDPIIGTAATAGRGFMQSSALEASNVDLSKSLTNLIIIQRGYQANGKTITTSDTLLETLIGLKR
ncbi:flagellar hook-basal body complex protein [Sulfuricurvum sp.]|uniref:flagellar hook-basal body complex protein n=1 Tax=Sulfuricurvum sp. TaxID=2025608 RepID=UPI00260561E9|nr:flagellar hook-basal body complex protein [Sulfuricurvum sp.]MDD2781835.1 flagellar hook-basal body complex protein [Sulfuricurvum sp.]